MGWRGPTTARQLDAWDAWFEESLNRPSRTDHYLMQIADEVRRIFTWLTGGKYGAMKDFLLTFRREVPKQQTEESIAEGIKQSKAAWFAAVGIKKTGA